MSAQVDDAEPAINDAGSPPRHSLLVDMAAAVARADEPIEFAVDPIAARGFVTVVAGQHSSLKTWLMLGASHAVHAGKDEIAGLPCRQGVALYVDAENGPRLMGRRFRSAGIPADGLLVADGFQIRIPQGTAQLRALIEETEATLVTLDSLRRLAPGARENESDDMAPVFAAISTIARDLDVAIVVIHHRSTKANAPTSRGSSAIEDQADLVFTLGHVQGDPEADRRKLDVVKFRIDEDPNPIWLQLGRVDEAVTIDAAEPYEAEGRPATKRNAIRDRAVELVRQAGTGLTRSEIARALDREPDDSTVKRAVRAVVEAGELLLNDGVYRVPEGVRSLP